MPRDERRATKKKNGPIFASSATDDYYGQLQSLTDPLASLPLALCDDEGP
jgi:hypothetical protein